MNDSFFVRGFQSFGDLDSNLQRLRDRQFFVFENFAQSFSLDVFHRQKKTPFVFAEIVDMRDVRMRNGGSGAGFPLKTADQRVVFGERVRQNFDGDFSFEFGVFGEKNHARAAAPDNFQKFVTGKIRFFEQTVDL